MSKRKDKSHEKDELDEDIMEIESVNDEPVDATPANGKGSDTAKLKTTQLEEKIKALEEQVDREKKEQLYIRAESDTFRRRAIKERSDALKYAGERPFASILGVLDNFERVFDSKVTADNYEKFLDGVRLIAEELKSVLKREGVEEVQPKNDKFDPEIFEAISSEPTDEKPPGDIAKVFRKAYKLHDRIIRPGQVVIAREPEADSEDNLDEDLDENTDD